MEAMSAYESMLYSNLRAEEDREERNGGRKGMDNEILLI